MKREYVLTLLAQHQKELAEFGIRRLALFGSVARNESTTESDIDFLVEFEGEPTFDRYVELNFYLESLLNRSVDLVTIASLRDFMRSRVEKEAIDVQGLSPLPR
jgi:predicted nucleotidyltransferase